MAGGKKKELGLNDGTFMQGYTMQSVNVMLEKAEHRTDATLRKLNFSFPFRSLPFPLLSFLPLYKFAQRKD